MEHHLNITQDWFTHQEQWMLEQFKDMAGKPSLKGLEIGSFEGLSACWFMQTVLTDSDSQLVCIDNFCASTTSRDAFLANTSVYGSRIRLIVGNSADMLRRDQFFLPTFDFIYVDGSHFAYDVLADAVLAFRALKIGGLMLFDDYLWPMPPESKLWEGPKPGIDAFLDCYAPFITIRSKSYRVCVEKAR